MSEKQNKFLTKIGKTFQSIVNFIKESEIEVDVKRKDSQTCIKKTDEGFGLDVGADGKRTSIQLQNKNVRVSYEDLNDDNKIS